MRNPFHSRQRRTRALAPRASRYNWTAGANDVLADCRDELALIIEHNLDAHRPA